MCLLIKGTDKPIILEKDMSVFKYGLVRDNMFIPMWMYHYHYLVKVPPRRILLTPIPGNQRDCYLARCSNAMRIVEGYHAGTERDRPMYCKAAIKQMPEKFIPEGFVKALATFIVPANSMIYYGTIGDIVADNILYTGKWEALEWK